jgi:hypothetical protein
VNAAHDVGSQIARPADRAGDHVVSRHHCISLYWPFADVTGTAS